MSYYLWKYFYDDDVDTFRQYLARATFDRNAAKGAGGGAGISAGTPVKAGSPGVFGTSPRIPSRSKRSAVVTPGSGARSNAVVLTRGDINARDAFGRTLLHHAVSSHRENALEFVRALLELPLLDLYAQDTESGWTALHRALYYGNIAAAQALMARDIHNATDYTTHVSHSNAGGLVKIKDNEGNSPFEVFGLTIAPRDLISESSDLTAGMYETGSVASADMDTDRPPTEKARRNPVSVINLRGEEVFAFGSNKNLTLGLEDGNDRHYPERVNLIRPQHLLERLHQDYLASRSDAGAPAHDDAVGLPAVIVNRAVVIQDVVMCKLHTAMVTDDPISNLHMCGFGPGGRLGTGDESTKFALTCIQAGGLARRKVTAVALGQDHTVVVCSSGEVFTWGSNKYGQLGYELPEVTGTEVPLQLTPRQIYGLIKKEPIIGTAASSIHSAIYTSTSLYTFGKNDGQLGLMDADARSLDKQTIPRRIGVSILQHAIESVSAIDRATVVLLENHEVIVFTHYAFTKIVFPLDSFGSSSVSNAFFLRHNREVKYIRTVKAAGNTICALTSYGEVFTVDVPARLEAVPASKSTTNPSKARNALPAPNRVWSIRKSHMAATDAAVGQNGSIILCTAAGTVWQKEKRANIKSVHHGPGQADKTKDYKFVRVPNIFGAVSVRSNAFGAFMAIRKDYDTMKECIAVEASTLWENIFNLLAFHDYGFTKDDERSEEPRLRFWRPSIKGPCPALIRNALLTRPQSEEELAALCNKFAPLADSSYDTWIASNVTDVRLPVHSIVLKARSKTLRNALTKFASDYYFSIPDVLSIEYDSDGQVQLMFQGADFFTITNLVLYMYADTVADFWRHTSQALHMAPRYRQVRTELMKIATTLDMKHLERAVRVMDEPARCLQDDFEVAFHDSDLFADTDVVMDLADNEERYAHRTILQSRCPFFEGLFHGHTGGMWMADRSETGTDGLEIVRVDLRHVEAPIFELVLQHIYADTGEELFDAIVTDDLDGFIDIVIEVLAVANELMLERLSRICQQVIGKYVTPRNICGLLNTVAESSETEFKQAALEYICLNLECMLDQRFLEELDDYLFEELDEMVQSNQLAFMPFARSNRALEVLLETSPELADQLDQARKRRVDGMRLRSWLVDDKYKPKDHGRSKLAHQSSATASPQLRATIAGDKRSTPPPASPVLDARATDDENMPFDMDDDAVDRSPLVTPSKERPSREHSPNRNTEFARDVRTMSTSVMSEDAMDVPSVKATGDASGSHRPAWTVAEAKLERIDMRDIMQQDASRRVSNLTQSLQAAAGPGGKTTVKVSQKERKRRQQELKAQALEDASSGISSPSAESSKGATSPWQTITARPALPPPAPSVAHASSTVNGATSSTSTPQVPSQKSLGITTDKGPATPPIQSIRHTPLPVRSHSSIDARTPLADILAQQQIEKISITQPDRRSLQEIQQEQEFQAWWDNESQRVQAEEAAAAAVAVASQVRSGRGRDGRERGHGRRKALDRDKADRPHGLGPPEAGAVAGRVASSARLDNRGSHRGRGGRGGADKRGRGPSSHGHVGHDRS